jgi:hypothetical protein
MITAKRVKLSIFTYVYFLSEKLIIVKFPEQISNKLKLNDKKQAILIDFEELNIGNCGKIVYDYAVKKGYSVAATNGFLFRMIFDNNFKIEDDKLQEVFQFIDDNYKNF